MKTYLLHIIKTAFIVSLLFISSAGKSQSTRFTVGIGYGFFYNDPVLRSGSHLEMTQSVAGPFYLKAFKMTDQYVSREKRFGRMEYGFSLNYYHMVYHEPGYMIIHTDSTTQAVADTWINQINGINILFRYNFHLADQKRFDPYLGLGAGLKITLINLDEGNPGCSGEECSYNWPYGLNYTWPFAIEAVVGVRYHIIPHLSAYCEMGFSKTAVQVGLCTGF